MGAKLGQCRKLSGRRTAAGVGVPSLVHMSGFAKSDKGEVKK